MDNLLTMGFKPFIKGNKFSHGRPKGSRNRSTVLKHELVEICLTALNEGNLLKDVGIRDILKVTAPLLPKEQTIHQDQSPITIQIECKEPQAIDYQGVVDVNDTAQTDPPTLPHTGQTTDDNKRSISVPKNPTNQQPSHNVKPTEPGKVSSSRPTYEIEEFDTQGDVETDESLYIGKDEEAAR